MARYTLSRDFYIPKGSVKITPKGVNAEIYIYELTGKVYALGFSGKRNKPDFHNRFRTLQSREDTITTYIANRLAHQTYKDDLAAKRRGFKHGYKVGDLLHYSWGYDQTQCDYFQVVDRTNSTVTIRAIGGKTVDKGPGWSGMSCFYSAVKDSFLSKSEPFIKRVQYSENGPGYISMKFGSASLTNETDTHYCSWYA